jgi:uncharacterized protein (DUF952 family)
LPAFRPDRCIREEEPNSDVSQKLGELHRPDGADGYKQPMPPGADGYKRQKLGELDEEIAPEILYHMCQQSLWEDAKSAGKAYFPPTFSKDGFTHATAVPSRLITTANHFYQDVPGDWVCLRFRRSALLHLGITTRDEEAMPVGEKGVSQDFSKWICPHVIGGIPPQVVDREFRMLRNGPAYTEIEGLTDVPQRVFKLATAAEAQKFRDSGKVLSELDEKDGFVHLSGPASAVVVAKHFFTKCTDLRLFEINACQFAAPVNWIVGAMGDAQPDDVARSAAPTVVHFLRKEGCVHVYGKDAVTMDMVVREAPVPLGDDGIHKFPEWL